MDYSISELMERLGPVATVEDAEAAWERAEDWYNATPKADVLNWYSGYCLDNTHAADIVEETGDDSGQLVEDWNKKVIFHRAASLADA